MFILLGMNMFTISENNNYNNNNLLGFVQAVCVKDVLMLQGCPSNIL